MKKIISICILLAALANISFAQIFNITTGQSNVLYLDTDNPLTVYAEGLNNDDIILYADNGTVVKQDGKFYLKPLAWQPVSIILKKKTGEQLTEIGRANFQVSRRPEPVIRLGTGISRISTPDIRLFWDVASLEWPVADIRNEQLTIESFAVTVMHRSTNTFEKIINTGSKLTAETKDLLKTVKPGDEILVSEAVLKNEKQESRYASLKAYYIK